MKTEFQSSAHPFSLVIFGASGSLARLKLFPALYELEAEARLKHDYQIFGFGRSAMTDTEFRDFFEKSVREHVEHVDEQALTKILTKIHYFQGDYDAPADYKKLEKSLKYKPIAYLSVPPVTFSSIFKGLSGPRWKLVIEKPFGSDLKSAQKLQRELKKYFKEQQIFLLDHYLGKEAVSNLLALRYANSILTDLLHKDFVANIQISALENKDIEGRASYFDQVGILRDMVQSHLLQILAYFTMHAPLQETAAAIQHEKTRLLKMVKIDPKSVIRGQYQGYATEKGIAKNSMTETYAALKVSLNHPNWKGVPIYIRSGKALKQKWTSVVVEFKPRGAQRRGKVEPNRLVIDLQPNEKIEFHLLTKLGGKLFDFHPLTTGRPIYCSGDCLSEHGRLLLSALEGKKDLFLGFDEIMASWRVLDPIQKVCTLFGKNRCKPVIYKKGSLGPKDNFKWFNPKDL